MSTNPNDPFENPNSPQHTAQQTAGAPAYGQDGFPQQQQSSSVGKWLIGCGLAGVLGVLVCCGGGYMLIQFSLNAIGTTIRSEIAESPVVEEHLGQIESFSFDFGAFIDEAENQEPGQAPPLVFAIEGTKGSGQIFVQPSSGGGSTVESAVLVLPSGDRYPIELSGPDAELEGFDIEDGDFVEPGTAQE